MTACQQHSTWCTQTHGSGAHRCAGRQAGLRDRQQLDQALQQHKSHAQAAAPREVASQAQASRPDHATMMTEAHRSVWHPAPQFRVSSAVRPAMRKTRSSFRGNPTCTRPRTDAEIEQKGPSVSAGAQICVTVKLHCALLILNAPVQLDLSVRPDRLGQVVLQAEVHHCSLTACNTGEIGLQG